MKQVTTNDGSITFLNEDVDETYHSHSGAKEEAVKKYVEPSGFIDFIKNNDSVTLLQSVAAI